MINGEIISMPLSVKILLSVVNRLINEKSRDHPVPKITESDALRNILDLKSIMD